MIHKPNEFNPVTLNRVRAIRESFVCVWERKREREREEPPLWLMSMMSWVQTKQRKMGKIFAEIMSRPLLCQAGIQSTLPLRETLWSIADLLLIFTHWHRQNKMCVCLIYCDCQMKWKHTYRQHCAEHSEIFALINTFISEHTYDKKHMLLLLHVELWFRNIQALLKISTSKCILGASFQEMRSVGSV